jgi:hypothetical protein
MANATIHRVRAVTAPERMPLSLQQFEQIDRLHSSLIRMGDFLTCADPRAYIAISNRLLDACIDAGMSYDEPSHAAWAVDAITRALVAA